MEDHVKSQSQTQTPSQKETQKQGVDEDCYARSIYPYAAMRSDELSFPVNAEIHIMNKGEDTGGEWWIGIFLILISMRI